jgi:predicted outer membrane repeat protein
MVRQLASSILALSLAATTLLMPSSAAAAGTVGNGTPASCTEAALTTALNGGGNISFNCGAAPHTITITSSKTTVGTTSIDGGGLISLSGPSAGLSYIFNVNSGTTLNLSNITIRDNGTTENSIGTTMLNAGTANLTNVKFINNNRLSIRNGGGTMTIIGGYFEDNTSSGFGGAISNESGGTLTVRDSTFVNNRSSTSHSGGAIYNGEDYGLKVTSTTISRSVFSNNASALGGGISNYGTLTISDSTFSGNTASDGGGAIHAASDAELNILNTTISGNTARRGGGIYAGGPVASNAATLTNVTLANNVTPATAANTGGANIRLEGNINITLRNTIIATSTAGLDNCVDNSAGSIVVEGGNLQFPNATCGAMPSADPLLSPLADNGGLTATHAIAANSPARNTANNDTCRPTDQRGVLRPQDINCDIGAFEYGAVPFLQTFGPTCGISGGRAFTVNVAGYNFITGPKGSRIVVNGTELPTTFVSPTQLTAVIPAGFLTTAPGTSVPLSVLTPVVDGGSSAQQKLGVCRTIHIPQIAK